MEVVGDFPLLAFSLEYENPQVALMGSKRIRME
jgi:hypothetical protein